MGWFKQLFTNRASSPYMVRPSASADQVRTNHGSLHADVSTLYFWHLARQDAEHALAILYAVREVECDQKTLPDQEYKAVVDIVANAVQFYDLAIAQLEEQVGQGDGFAAVQSVRRREQEIHLPGGYSVRHPASERYTRYTDMARYGRPSYRGWYNAPEGT